MAIQIVDLKKAVDRDVRRTDIWMTRRMHSWLLYFDEPGEDGKMHCHNNDETFYCVQGECTMSFLDGGKVVIKPGMLAVIPGDEFYHIASTGTEPMMLLGNRSGVRQQDKKINYDDKMRKRAEKAKKNREKVTA